MNLQPTNNQNGHVETDMFDIGGFLRFFSEAARVHKFIVLFTCLLTLVLVTWYVYVWPPIYSVDAQLVAERDLDPSRDTFYASWQIFRKEDARDEIKLFTAGVILKEVIEKNNLKFDDVYHPFMTHASYVWEKSWLGKEYKAIKSKFVPDRDELPKDQQEFGRTMEGLKAGIAIAIEGDSNVATVTVKGPNNKVAGVANSLIDAYLANRKARHAQEAQAAYEVLTREAERAGAELAAVRDKREAFATRNGLLMDFQKETQDVKELTDLETSIANHKAKLSALQGSLDEVQARMKDEPPEKVLASIRELNTVRENAKLKRLELQTALIGLRNKYREDSPEVREAVADLAKLDALIAQEPEQIDRSVTKGVNATYQQLTASRLDLMSQLEAERGALATQEQIDGQMRQHLEALPQLTSAATDIQRDYDILKEKYQRLLFRRMEAQVSATSAEAAPASVRVVDYAQPPSSKYWPRMKYLYPGALAVGLLLGMLAAVIRSLTAGRLLQSDVDLGRIASPVYATVAFGERHRSLTVLPRQAAPVELPANTPQKETDRSREAGM